MRSNSVHSSPGTAVHEFSKKKMGEGVVGAAAEGVDGSTGV